MTRKTELPSDAERTAAYEAELIRRYEAGLPLTSSDKREARRLIKERGKKSEADLAAYESTLTRVREAMETP